MCAHYKEENIQAYWTVKCIGLHLYIQYMCTYMNIIYSIIHIFPNFNIIRKPHLVKLRMLFHSLYI